MGPSTDVDGEDDRRRSRPARDRDALQWGRRQTSTESRRTSLRRYDARRLAQLLQWGRRQTSTESAVPVSTGSRRRSTSCPRRAALQWGRRQTSTESRASRVAERAPDAALQWGRRQTSTESRSAPARWQPLQSGFNGAVDRRRRRADCAVAARSRSLGALQWGRRQTSTESSCQSARRLYRCLASMGPSTDVDGEPSHDAMPACGRDCFNGAVDRRRRRPCSVGDRQSHRALQWGRRHDSTETP